VGAQARHSDNTCVCQPKKATTLGERHMQCVCKNLCLREEATYLVSCLYEEKVWCVHAKELQQIKDRDDEVKEGVAEAAHKVI
jgi:hypothetical protein